MVVRQLLVSHIDAERVVETLGEAERDSHGRHGDLTGRMRMCVRGLGRPRRAVHAQPDVRRRQRALEHDERLSLASVVLRLVPDDADLRTRRALSLLVLVPERGLIARATLGQPLRSLLVLQVMHVAARRLAQRLGQSPQRAQLAHRLLLAARVIEKDREAELKLARRTQLAIA